MPLPAVTRAPFRIHAVDGNSISHARASCPARTTNAAARYDNYYNIPFVIQLQHSLRCRICALRHYGDGREKMPTELIHIFRFLCEATKLIWVLKYIYVWRFVRDRLVARNCNLNFLRNFECRV